MSSTRFCIRTRVLFLGTAALVVLIVFAVTAEMLLRAQVESAMAACGTTRAVEIELGRESVLWSLATGGLHVDVHVDEEQMQNAVAAKGGDMVGEITMSDGLIFAELGGSAATLLGDGAVIEFSAEAVEGKITLTVAGVLIDGQQRAGGLLSGMAPIELDPATMMGSDSVPDIHADEVRVSDGDMVVSLRVPTDAVRDASGC